MNAWGGVSGLEEPGIMCVGEGRGWYQSLLKALSYFQWLGLNLESTYVYPISKNITLDLNYRINHNLSEGLEKVLG